MRRTNFAVHPDRGAALDVSIGAVFEDRYSLRSVELWRLWKILTIGYTALDAGNSRCAHLGVGGDALVFQ